jgi:hypothetical protein
MRGWNLDAQKEDCLMELRPWIEIMRAVVLPAAVAQTVLFAPSLWMSKTVALCYVISAVGALAWVVRRMVVQDDPPALLKRWL